MQILHPGDLVHARHQRWHIVSVRAYDECQLVTVCGAGHTNAGLERSFLTPFDAIEAVQQSDRLRRVRPARWRAQCRSVLTRGFVPDGLRAIGRARIELLAHQLEPAIAVVRGIGSRVLLADDVGLGKTIQAGIIVAELRARGAADRILVLTPAGLREQWAAELSDRFDLRADIVDFARVRRQVAALPPDVNPWLAWPLAVASIDYVKRIEVLRAVLSVSWDVVVVDEAHGAAAESDRHHAVAEISARTPYVVLLTATPHNGDHRAFASLCGLGEQGDRLVAFRRTRDVLRAARRRRVHCLMVRPSEAELRMHALLGEFARAIREERGDLSRDMWIALAVLHKRALSSARSLEQSVLRRLAAQPLPADSGSQLTFRFDDQGEHDAGDEAPPWVEALQLSDAAREGRLLRALADAAAAAALHETKLSALSRLLARVNEPVIVFTEYRDTLLHVAAALHRPMALLHGRLSRAERTTALESFRAGHDTVLIATDAAGEGLNLQGACRTVVNLELPWNPMRLEQRIGRVDRIGQKRTVHAFHLVAEGTGEGRLLDRLRRRITRAQADIGAADPLGGSEAEMAMLVIDGRTPAPLDTSPEKAAVPLDRPALGADARAAAARIEATRQVDARSAVGSGTSSHEGRPLIAIARKGATRARLGARVLLIWEISINDGCGSRVGTTAVGTALGLYRLTAFDRTGAWLDPTIRSLSPDLSNLVEATTGPWRMDAVRMAGAFLEARIARERAIADRLRSRAALFQPGLFDRRAHDAHAAAFGARVEALDASRVRLETLERRSQLSPQPARLLLVLVP